MQNEISDALHGAAKDRLRAFVERVETLNEEKAALMADLREVFAEAKSDGYDTAAIKACVKARREDEHERLAREALINTYMHALGLIV